MKYKIQNSIMKAFSVVEILIAIGVFTIVAGSVSILAVDSIRNSQNQRLQFQAAAKIEEATNAILLNKNEQWLNILNNTDNGPKHISYNAGAFEIADSEEIDGDITFSFIIETVYRDALGNIVQTGGTADINSREVTMTASWLDSLGRSQSVVSNVYITNWNTPTWVQTTESDFQAGTIDSTIVTATGGGAVELDLDSTIRGDWCLPQLTVTQYNMPRQGVPTSIVAEPNFAYLATGENASGPPLEHVQISSTNPPVVELLQSYNDNLKVSDIAFSNDYIYLATTDKSRDVTIFNATTNPFQQVGYYDYSSAKSPATVWVDGNVGYVIYENTLDTFDLSSVNGSRPRLGTIDLQAFGVDIKVVNGYAYVGLASASTQMQIINVSDPVHMSAAGTVNLTSQQARAVFVSPDGNRAYLATAQSSTQDEFFIIDTTVKTGQHAKLSSLDSQGTDPRDISVINNRAILIGVGGQEYQVIQLDNEASPAKCGGIENSAGLYGVQTVIDQSGNAWAYVLTGDSNAELMIILGGETGGGGGNGQGSQYLESGTFESSVFDTGNAQAYYYSLTWDEQLYDNTDLRLQIRTGTTADLSSVPWSGPDGTVNTFYTDPGGELIHQNSQLKRYIQYKAYFTSDKINTPVLQEIRINYQ